MNGRDKYPARLRQPRRSPLGALRMLLACAESSSATSYGDVAVLRSEDRGMWADAIEAARYAIAKAEGKQP